eukprot:gb/GECG01009631.1/.p1 GENE.gb/GECG01009631.1/~~gb/GECG01009631.1/.p1  ORF type:complete len:134 (+),score=10.66 gb/GECG01009631.1/:1-402(+)
MAEVVGVVKTTEEKTGVVAVNEVRRRDGAEAGAVVDLGLETERGTADGLLEVIVGAEVEVPPNDIRLDEGTIGTPVTVAEVVTESRRGAEAGARNAMRVMAVARLGMNKTVLVETAVPRKLTTLRKTLQDLLR